MSDFTGKVVFISGVARGQGRAHALELASRGADIIGIDICQDINSMDYPNASHADLKETIRLVEATGRRMVGRIADVRDREGLAAAFAEGHAEFGRVDIIIANAGIVRLTPSEGEQRAVVWRDIIDVNLTGVWNTIEVALPAMRQSGNGGSIVITSSSAGLKGTGSDLAGSQAYTAAKRGLVGLMQTLANEYAAEWIRVNTVHPTGVASGMTMNATMEKLFAAAGAGEGSGMTTMQNALPIDILQSTDIAKAVAWLVSDEAKFITGIALPLDAGFSVR
ncbi:mycofactocin-coupled SDR family oxidoreductase [Rhodococcus wratislaviensis]|uniref:Putative oxidoreductase n=1 Tax=Rhodococcus wratislaviensis NBRC 100605 TaxID=1219028 RepID=X0PZ02_RHOWR|nr:mycofactocin-coupled SDR family oxidoreductase [Rhodococcus wratislaviensis]GAF48879.1 putative oxidoreductase [Rhodococcus wratislaviensis NBRC 100605]